MDEKQKNLKDENEFLKDVLENLELRRKIQRIQREIKEEEPQELVENLEKEKIILHG